MKAISVWLAFVIAMVSPPVFAQEGAVPSPHVLVLDDVQLKSAVANVDVANAKAALATVLPQLMTKYHANIVLKRGATFWSADSVNITAQVFEQLRQFVPLANRAPEPQSSINDSAVSEPQIAILNDVDLANSNPGLAINSESVYSRLAGFLEARGVTILLHRDFIIYSAAGAFDLTSDLSQQLSQGDARMVPDAHPPLPAPIILSIDRRAVRRTCKAGQDLVLQIREETDKSEREFKAEAASLKEEQERLSQKVASGPPGTYKKQIAAFIAKSEAFRRKVQGRQRQLELAVVAASKTIDDAMDPIIVDLMRERNANLVIDQGAIAYATVSEIDVTQATANSLDQILPSLKVAVPDGP